MIIVSCEKKETPIKVFTDPHSFSRPDKAIVKHLDIDVDFETATISGKASWTIDNTSKGNEIIFDANTLEISKVTLDDDAKEADFHLGKEVIYHGKPLHITIKPNTTRINISYKSTKDNSLPGFTRNSIYLQC